MIPDDGQSESKRRTPIATGGGRAAVLRVSALLACLIAGCQNGRPTVFDSMDRAVARAHVRRGEQLLAASKTDEATEAFRRAVSADARCATAHARLGEMNAATGDLDNATEHFRAAVKSDPENLGYALALAEHLRAAAPTSMDPPRTLRAAVRAYRHARSIDATQLPVAIGLAACFRSFGANRVALQTLFEARRLHDDSAELHCAIATTHLRLGEDEPALAAYGEALGIDPDCIAAHNGAGQINTRLIGAGVRQTLARERAAAHLRRSLELDADQPRIRAMLDALGGAQRHAAARALDE